MTETSMKTKKTNFKLSLLVITLLALSVPAFEQPASACSCMRIDPQAGLAAADAAFVGTLLSREEPNPLQQFSGSASEVTWRFKVDRALKGGLGSEVDVKSAVSGASCGFEVTPGEKVGVFLRGVNGDWSGGLCSQLSPEALLAAAKSAPGAGAESETGSTPRSVNRASKPADSESVEAWKVGLAMIAIVAALALALKLKERRSSS